jgi:hypothetical protein
MAHFARVNSSNLVTRVDKVDNEYLLDENGVEQESLGITHQNSVYGDISPDKWIQTSYNTYGGKYFDGSKAFDPDLQEEIFVPAQDQSKALRKNFAGIGMTYDEGRDAFIRPKPFDSWSLNETTCDWEAPVAIPPNSAIYGKEISWDEENQKWIGNDYTTEVDYEWNPTTLSWEEIV